MACVIFTGAGERAFCVGGDQKYYVEHGGYGTSENGLWELEELQTLIRSLPKPVIAAVNGHAFGGGIGLVAAADIAIAAESARFSFSEVRLGLIPAMISVVVLPKLGAHRTMRLFLTGERFMAARALEYGLLHRVVAAEELTSAVQEEVDAIDLGGPIAIAEAKKLIRTVARLPMDEAFAYAEQKINELFRSEEAAEGMAAFVAKRKPEWTKSTD